MAQPADAPNQFPLMTLITLHWESDGVPKTQRMWGFVRTIQDPLWTVPRADIELCQPAFFGVPPGPQTLKIQKRTSRKRRREKEAEDRDCRRRVEENVQRVAREATIDTWEEIRGEEARVREEERMRREQESVEAEDQGDPGGLTALEIGSAVELHGY